MTDYDQNILKNVYNGYFDTIEQYIRYKQNIGNPYPDIDYDGLLNEKDDDPHNPYLPQYSILTVEKKGSGKGTITSDTGDINCTEDQNGASESFLNETTVTLTAQPSAGSLFWGWYGGGCSGTGTCEIVMTGPVNIEATFVDPDNQKAHTPVPADRAEDQSRYATDLDWDYVPLTTSYKVYFGTSSNLTESNLVSTQGWRGYNLPILEYDTTYYWRIDSKFGYEEEWITGDVWQFTTGEEQNYAPHVSRVSPDYSDYYVTGQTQLFTVKATDTNGNLSHVVWSAGDEEINDENKAEKSTSINIGIPNGGRVDCRDDDEDEVSINISINGDNDGNHMYVYATIYDTAGEKRQTKWVVNARLNKKPVLTAINPEPDEVQLLLGDASFEISVFDEDDNTKKLEWWLDGVLVESNSLGGGNPASTETYKPHFSLRAVKTLKAIAIDEDDNKTEMVWKLNIGADSDNNLPPSIDYLGLHSSSIPYQVFRAGRPYEFKLAASDPDGNLYKLRLELDGNVINERDFDPEIEKDIHSYLNFPQAGEYQLKGIAIDNNDVKTEQAISLKVEASDATKGTAPQLYEVHPAGSELYAGTSLNIIARIKDAELDQYKVEFFLDNKFLKEESIYGRNSEDFSIRDLPSSGTHTLKLVPVDVAGNRGTEITYTLNMGSSGSNAPKIIKVVPPENETVNIHTGEKAELYVFVEDIDGDLDRIEWNMAGVGDPEPEDDSNLSGRYEDQQQTIKPTRSGQVTATVFDKKGNKTTKTFDIQYGDSQSYAPVLLRPNFTDNQEFVRNEDFVFELSFDVFDRDGDLNLIQIFQNGIEIENLPIGGHEHAYDGTILTGCDYVENLDPPNIRGASYEYRVKVSDLAGNSVEKIFTIIQGPVNQSNHAPVVDTDINISTQQRGTTDFKVSVLDEENDAPVPTVPSMSHGGIVEYLGDYRFKYVPDSDFFGNETFEIHWDDGFGGTAVTRVNASVEKVVRPPQLSSTHETIRLSQGETYNLAAALAGMAESDEYETSALSFQVQEKTNIDIAGTNLNKNPLLVSFLSGFDSGQLKGVVKDPDGRESEPLHLEFILDSDGDGVLDLSDAFKFDKAASVDSDGDLHPDQWNPGMNHSDSTTGLKLDAFPDERGRWNYYGPVYGDPTAGNWYVYPASAKLGNIDLTTDDEIGIFDGNTLVGSVRFQAPLTSDNALSNPIAAWASLNDGNGYTPGNVYQFKLWKADEKREYTSFSIQFDDSNQDSYSGTAFPEGDAPYSIVHLKFNPFDTQLIDLPQHYKFISFNVNPDDSNLLQVFSGVLDSLIFIKDSKGNLIRKIGPNWNDNIGNFDPARGYLVKMLNPETIHVTGEKILPSMNIPLEPGYQFIPFLPEDPVDAELAFDGILENLNFAKDSKGNILRKIGPAWVNNIGDLNSGSGYLVKMNTADTLQYEPAVSPQFFTGSIARSAASTTASAHFGKVGGNPADPTWDIFLSPSTLDGNALDIGDEIAVFDGEKLVGSYVLTKPLTSDDTFFNSLKTWTTLNDGAGYGVGNPISFRLWDKSAGIEYTNFEVSFDESIEGAYSGNLFPGGDIPYSIATLNFIGEGASKDTDNDGVSDAQDQCPGTPAGTIVNSNGCGRIKGDVNGDGRVDLKDSILSLQVPSIRTSASGVFEQADVNEDNKISVPETVYSLQILSGAGKECADNDFPCPEVDLTSGLVVYYSFDGNTEDVSGNDLNATEYGNTSYSNGKSGQSISFDGNDAYLKTSTSNLLKINSTLSFTAWINLKDTGNRHALAAQGTSFDTTGNWEVYVQNDGTISLMKNNVPGAVANSSGKIVFDSWNHIAVTFSYGVVKFYINGALDSSKDLGVSSFNTTSDGIKIGEREYSDATDDTFGVLDELYFYNRVLSDLEITLLHNNQSSKWYKDVDEDSYSDGISKISNTKPSDDYYKSSELISIFGDLNDDDNSIFPGAPEICGDGIDQDCDGSDLACPDTESNDLVVHYPFDTDTDDASGNGNHATFQNGAVLSNGKAVFNGVNNAALSSDPISIDSNSLTIATKFQWDGGACTESHDRGDTANSNRCGIIGMSDDHYPNNQSCYSHGGRHWRLSVTPNDKSLNLFWHHDGCQSTGKNYVLLSGSVEPDVEYKVVVTMSNGQIKAYVNGTQVLSEIDMFPMSAFNQELEVGRQHRFYYSGTYPYNHIYNYFSGTIDDVRIYDRALEDSEIHTIWD
ncbi:LamG-like jellyroll fold domain-containing protein [Desulfobacter latus]|uniref:Cadherin domain-containing protein n=1 Tax=Desulfobacter latus TaxID=2292 RepID=A0A850T170_9BACT|nr:LamG-like jellyroll fold domain-containing protein [Desulfobacter latus]NWH04841.1 hypothetical protein [Desulfobacter latus]